MKKYAVPSYKQVTTPWNPDVNFNKLYFKADNVLYMLDSSWNELSLLNSDYGSKLDWWSSSSVYQATESVNWWNA